MSIHPLNLRQNLSSFEVAESTGELLRRLSMGCKMDEQQLTTEDIEMRSVFRKFLTILGLAPGRASWPCKLAVLL